jgi:hypothetical protein
MGKAGAVLMLVVVALWAAAPAFACLAPTQSHACCRHMAMPDCDMTSMGTTPACCQLQAPDAGSMPALGSMTQRPIAVAQVVQRLAVAAVVLHRAMLPTEAETPPPLAVTGGSILRI